MALENRSGNENIYLVDISNPKPSSSDFENFLGYFSNWSIKQKLNQIASFEGEAYGVTDALKSKFNANNYIYVISGSMDSDSYDDNLIGKFVISRPEYSSRGKLTVKANQSTGSEWQDNGYSAPRNLLKTNTPKTKYNQIDTRDVFAGSSPQGIAIDLNGNNIIRLGFDGDDPLISMNVDFTNRIKATDKLANISKKEWVITHGNITSSFNGGDILTLSDRVGISSSAYTFHLEGANTNATIGSGTEQLDSSVNHITVQGRDINGKQVESEMFDSTNDTTELGHTIDAWLDDNLNHPSATTFTLKSGHGFDAFISANGYGDGGSDKQFYVRIDNEIIKCARVSGNTVYVASDGRGEAAIGTTTTQPAKHKSGSDVVLIDDGRYDISGSTASIRVYVDDYSSLPSSGNIYVGVEEMSMYNNTGSYLICIRSALVSGGNWNNAYAHSHGTRVASASYGIDNPETGTSIYEDGLMSETTADNSALTRDDLDKTAQQILESKKVQTDKNGNENITIEVWNPREVWHYITDNGSETPIGCAVRLEDCSSINIEGGDYRIVEYEYSWPPNKLVLYLNNESVRGYSEGSFDFTKSFYDSTKEDRQDPSRETDKQRAEETDDVDEISGFMATSGKLDGVVVPKDAWDDIAKDPKDYMNSESDNSAASVGFVRANAGGGGSGLWTEDMSDLALHPYTDRSIVPNTDGYNSVGIPTKRWGYIYSEFGDFEGAPNTGNSLLDVYATGDGTGLSVRNDGTGDAFRAGYSVPYSSWNLRVDENVVGLWNEYMFFSDTNNYPQIRFFFNATDYSFIEGGSNGIQLRNDHGDALRAGYSTPYSSWNLRVDENVTGFWNEYAFFSYTNNLPELRFYSDATNYVGIRRNGTDLQYKPDTSSAWVDFSTANNWDRAVGYDSDYYLFPLTSTDKVRIDATGDNVFLAGRQGSIGTDEYNFRVADYYVSVYSEFDVHGNIIHNISEARFDSNSNNKIYDDDDDLFVQGRNGLRLQLTNVAGAVIVDNCTYFRPDVDFDNDIWLGASWARWKGLYVGTGGIIFNDGSVQTTASSGGGSQDLADVLSNGNSAGAHDIDMNGNDIYDVDDIYFTSSISSIQNTAGGILNISSSGGDVRIGADDDIDISADYDITIYAGGSGYADYDITIYAGGSGYGGGINIESYDYMLIESTNHYVYIIADGLINLAEDVYCSYDLEVGYSLDVHGSKNCIMNSTRGKVRLSAIESPDVWFEEKKSSQLKNGQKEIILDPIFQEVITSNEKNPLHVVVTPTSECNGLWVEKFTDKVIIHELNSGNSNANFDITVSAKRKNYEHKRFDIKNTAPKKGVSNAIQGYAVIKEGG